MARGINKVILVGNLGGDPEVRYMPSGGAVTNVTIATSESWKDKQSGQQQERTEWHRVVFFNRLAEIAGEHLRKGSQIYIEGSLRTRKWQDSSGQDKYTTEVVASEMQMLGGKGGSGGPAQQYQDYPQALQAAPTPQQQSPQQAAPRSRQNDNGSQVSPSAPVPQQPAQGFDDFDDDIPFANPYRHMEYLV